MDTGDILTVWAAVLEWKAKKKKTWKHGNINKMSNVTRQERDGDVTERENRRQKIKSEHK